MKRCDHKPLRDQYIWAFNLGLPSDETTCGTGPSSYGVNLKKTQKRFRTYYQVGMGQDQPAGSVEETPQKVFWDVNDLSWLLVAPTAQVSSAHLMQLYSEIQAAFRRSDYGLVDGMLSAVSVSDMPPTILVALLRYSFAMKRKLKNWASFKRAVADRLNSENQIHLLVGLER